jgi:hypothetical protein
MVVTSLKGAEQAVRRAEDTCTKQYVVMFVPSAHTVS